MHKVLHKNIMEVRGMESKEKNYCKKTEPLVTSATSLCQLYIYVCVCVCACVRACVRMCVRACVCASVCVWYSSTVSIRS